MSSVYEVFTEKESKHGNNGLACNLSCAEFVSDFVSKCVRVCVVLLRGLFSESILYISQLEGDHSPSVQQQCPEVESANLITARSPATQWEPGNRKIPASVLPMSLLFSSFCSCHGSKSEHHFSSGGILGHILCAEAGRYWFSFFPLSQIVLPPPSFI